MRRCHGSALMEPSCKKPRIQLTSPPVTRKGGPSRVMEANLVTTLTAVRLSLARVQARPALAGTRLSHSLPPRPADAPTEGSSADPCVVQPTKILGLPLVAIRHDPDTPR